MCIKESTTKAWCLNCRFSHKEPYGLLCWGEKEPPLVPPSGVCDSWKPKDDENGWLSIDVFGLPKKHEVVVAYTPCDGYQFLGYQINGDWYIYTAMRSTRQIRKNVSHWKPRSLPPAGYKDGFI